VLQVFRDGRQERVPLSPNRYLGIRLSPDGSRTVWAQGPTGEREVWMFDFTQGVPPGSQRAGRSASVD